MTRAAAPRVRALALHAGYRCRSTGVCCSSGWDIPVEPEPEEGLRRALREGRLRVPAGGERACLRSTAASEGSRVLLGADEAGRCVFLGPDLRCAVHRRLGEAALPSACRHFPRVVTLTPLGVSVSLSHYCPTAASTLFEGEERDSPDSRLAVVDDPPAFPPSWPWQGLDAREALPPLLRPGVLMSWPTLERWERFCAAALAASGRTPEAALAVLAGVAEEARRWTPREGSFETFFEVVLTSAASGAGHGVRLTGPPAGGRTAWRLVAGTVPHRERLPPEPEGTDEADARWVGPAWPSLARPVRRWLAARAFASWLVLQGEGLRTAVLGLSVALDVLRAEAARGSEEAGRVLDRALLGEAVRRADLLLVHLADPEALARRLSRCESAGRPPAAW